jgi:hypothetical protein
MRQYEKFIVFPCGGKFAGVVSGFLGYDENGNSVAVEKVGTRSRFTKYEFLYSDFRSNFTKIRLK